MKPVRGNLAVSPFSDFKELTSQNRYKTKTKPNFCDHFYCNLNVKLFCNE